MASIFRGLFARLFGGVAVDPEEDPVEYEGYRIRPTPYRRQGQYQTCGIIEKEIAGELKEHRFIRAELHPSQEAAVEFSIAKAKQIIDEQGERIFG